MPSARSVGSFSGTRRAMLPSVLLPCVAIRRRIVELADADAVEDDYDDSGKWLGHVARMDSTAASVSGCSPEV